MTVLRLVAREIAYRPVSFGLATVAVVVAVGSLTAELALLAIHDRQAEDLAESHETLARRRVATLEDDYRKIMLGLGYNVLVLPKDQDLAEFYSQGYPSATMSESLVRRLAESPTVTVQHLLPTLQQRVEWPERGTAVLLVGTRGEVSQAHRDPKKPILPPVQKGRMVVGHVLAEKLDLRAGQQTVFRGRTMTVEKVHPPRGNQDDVTVWIDLEEAQSLTGKPGLINAILALSCFCAEATPDGIRREITGTLGDEVQVVELAPQAAARRAARARAAEHACETVAAQVAGRQQLRQIRESLADWLVPTLVVGGTVWVGLLALANVRERKAEIGILRAVGVGTGKVFALFILRAVAVGLVGAGIGYAGGLLLAASWNAAESSGAPATDVAAVTSPALAVATVSAAAMVSVAASLVPAIFAARQDPALVLREG